MFQPRFSRFLVMLLLTALISACGGGSSSPAPQLPGDDDTGGGGTTNTAPEASGQSLNTDVNAVLDITLTGSDADGDTLTFTVTAEPASGTLTGTAPDLTYTPDADYIGSDSFSFTVNDGTEDSAEATVSITVDELLLSVGGTVTNHLTPVTLENNGDNSLEVVDVDFEFPTPLLNGHDYAVTLATPPQHQLCSVDNASGTLAGADVDDVSVLCRYWRTAGLIEDGTVDAYEPQIAADSAGNAIAVWEQDDNIYANYYSAGAGNWGTAVPIDNGSVGAFYPQVAFDGDGNATAVWEQGGEIWANRWSGSGWDGAARIDPDTGSVPEPSEPQIAIDSAGNAIVVWLQNFRIYSRRYSADNSNWGTAAGTIDNDTGEPEDPQIAVNSAGNAIAVWEQNNDIYTNRYSVENDDWGTTAELIEVGDGNVSNPQIAIDGNGNAITVWTQYDSGSVQSIYANRYSAEDDNWDAAELIESGSDSAIQPQIAIDGSGNAIAVWTQYDDDGLWESIYANRYTPDTGWDANAAELIENVDADAYAAQIAFDSAGNAIAVWSMSDDIYANLYSVDSGGWGTEELIEASGTGYADDPLIAIDGAGNAIAVWEKNDDSGTTNIEAIRFE